VICCLRLARLLTLALLLSSVGWSQKSPSYFYDEFTGTMLNPAWVIQVGGGDFSVSDKPDFLLHAFGSGQFVTLFWQLSGLSGSSMPQGLNGGD
jgi:hypothetical protein